MNAYRVALAVVLIQSSILIAGVADIPVACNPADKTACIYFSETLIASTTIQEIMINEFEDGQYRTTRIEKDILNMDVVSSAAIVLNKVASIISFQVAGVFFLVKFFLGSNPVSLIAATTLQAVVSLFMAKAAIDLIRSGGKGDI